MNDGHAKFGSGQNPDKKHSSRADHNGLLTNTISDSASRRPSKGRPRIGLGAVRVQATLEKSLLTRVDAYAVSHGITRSQLIARGLERILAED